MLAPPVDLMLHAFDRPLAALEDGAQSVLSEFAAAFDTAWAMGRETLAAVEEAQEGVFAGLRDVQGGLADLAFGHVGSGLAAAEAVLSARHAGEALLAQTVHAHEAAAQRLREGHSVHDATYRLGRSLIEPFACFTLDPRASLAPFRIP